jgi:opacity protein-like surface antigen
MKKLILSLFVILLISGMINAKISYLELRTNYFNPSNSDFKDIYGGGIQYGLELGFDIRESFTVWIGGSFFKKKGELTYTKEETTLKILTPVEIGIRFKLSKRMIVPYIGAGLSFNNIKETNPIGPASDNKLGYSVQVGILVKLIKRFSLDLRINASYCKVNPADKKVNIGGTGASIGLKYKF